MFFFIFSVLSCPGNLIFQRIQHLKNGHDCEHECDLALSVIHSYCSYGGKNWKTYYHIKDTISNLEAVCRAVPYNNKT